MILCPINQPAPERLCLLSDEQQNHLAASSRFQKRKHFLVCSVSNSYFPIGIYYKKKKKKSVSICLELLTGICKTLPLCFHSSDKQNQECNSFDDTQKFFQITFHYCLGLNLLLQKPVGVQPLTLGEGGLGCFQHRF